ncbi:hypothetical protein CCACVL1_19928, partial [Corchorus capsularis]
MEFNTGIDGYIERIYRTDISMDISRYQ